MENLHIELTKGNYIDINSDGTMTVKQSYQKVTDVITNFQLTYFEIYMGFDVCFLLENYTNKVRWSFEGSLKKEHKNAAMRFKEIMAENGLFLGKTRKQILYNRTAEEKQLLDYVTQRTLLYNRHEIPFLEKNYAGSAVQHSIVSQSRITATAAPQLISCPCCGKRVSNQALACPDCGQPIANQPVIREVVVQDSLNTQTAICCPRCGAKSVSVTLDTIAVGAKTKGEIREKSVVTNTANSVGRGAMIAATGGLWALTPKKSKYNEISTTKIKNKTVKNAVCQDCGYSWEIRV